MQKYHRDSFGRFSKQSVEQQQVEIVAGRLYQYKNITVRVLDVGKRNSFVTFHKVLTGIVPTSSLKLIDKNKVNQYLENA